MLIDELKDILKTTYPDITSIKDYWKNSQLEERFQELKTETLIENFWEHPDQAKILKEFQAIKQQRDQYKNIINSYNDLEDLISLFANDSDN